MNLIFAFVLSLCSVFKSAEVPYISSWEFVEDTSITKPLEPHKIKPHKATLPFLWANIDVRILDSMTIKGLAYDSMLNRLSSDSLSYLPQPVSCVLDSIFVLFSGRKIIKSNNCSYVLSTFYVNKGKVFFEHDCYEVFYIKEIGIIGAVHKRNEELSFDWDKYLLRDVSDRSGKSIVNKVMLADLVDQAINY